MSESLRNPQHRDVVVIGASAGGPEAIAQVCARLPADFPASIFIVQHISPFPVSRFPETLTRRGPLPAEYPQHGQAIERGKIYVAPADTHLQLRHGTMTVTRGARENSHRPSVDTLFRSAARAYGPRVIGVVLSGNLDCGSAGLLSIKARRGVTIAQDPSEAEAPDMPRNAIRQARPDHVVKLAQLPALLIELVAQPAPGWPAELDPAIEILEGERAGSSVDFACPACQGVLKEAVVGGFRQYRCHVGHTFSLECVLAEQSDETERALWSAVRALEESAALAGRAAASNTGMLHDRLLERRRVLVRDAQLVREILIGRETHPELDDAEHHERDTTPR